MSKRRMNIWKLVVFTLLPIIILLILLETICRLIPLDPQSRTNVNIFGTEYETFLRPHTMLQNSMLYRFDPELIYTVKPHISVDRLPSWGSACRPWSVSSDQNGFRNVNGNNPLTDTKVLLMGDSITFGLLVSDVDTYASRAQELLNNTLSPGSVSIVNAGVPGFDSLQGRLYLARLLKKLTPKIVVLAYGMNDQYSNKPYSRKETFDRFWKVSWVLKFLVHSELFNTIRRIHNDNTGWIPGNKTQVDAEEFLENLTAMVTLSQEKGANVILLDNFVMIKAPKYSKVMTQVAQKFNLPLIRSNSVILDQLKMNSLSGNELDGVMCEPIHPNPLGHSYIGEALGKAIFQIISKGNRCGITN